MHIRSVRGSMIIIITVVLMIVALAVLVSFNESAYVLSAENAVVDLYDSNIQTAPYLVSGEWKVYEGLYTPEELVHRECSATDIRSYAKRVPATYVLFLTAPKGTTLNQTAAVLHMWINDIEVLGYDGNPITGADSISLDDYSNGGDQYQIVVQSGNHRRGYCGFLAGTEYQIDGARQIWAASDMVTFSMYIILTAGSLAMFLQKRSEKYVLILCILSFLYLLRMFIGPGSLVRPSALPDILFADIYGVLRYFVLRYFVEDKLWKRCAVPVVIISALWFIGLAAGSYDLQNISYMAYLLLEGIVIAHSVIRRTKASGILLAGWAVAFIMEVFYLLINFGVIRQGLLDVYIRRISAVHLASLLSYAVFVFALFARKFKEADDLGARLEQRVAEQTEDLTRANAHLLRLQQEKRDMTANIAHNIKNPLFALWGYADILEKDDANLTPERARLYSSMYAKVNDMSQLVDDFLLLSKLEDNRVEMHSELLDLSGILRICAADASARGMPRGIGVKLYVEECLPELKGDSFRLKQAIDNILDNAVRHSPNDSEVLLQAELAEDNCIAITISDHGQGISRDNINNLFKRYDAKGNGGVTGLGLSIAKEIVGSHSGTLAVFSEEGKGTNVVIKLPCS